MKEKQIAYVYGELLSSGEWTKGHLYFDKLYNIAKELVEGSPNEPWFDFDQDYIVNLAKTSQ